MMVNFIKRVSIVLCGVNWKTTLVGIVTDSAFNMTGRIGGAVTLLS
jgi:uncharacterized membrane protein YuzA (DUF378 family)